MPDTNTPTYSFVLPEVGGSTGTWGTKTNTTISSVDSELARPRIPHNSPTVLATTTLDLSLARVFKFTVSQVTTIAITNVPASTFFERIVLKVTNGSAFAVTWPAAVKWRGTGTSTPLSPLQESGVDWVEMVTEDGGTTWFAAFIYTPTATQNCVATLSGDFITLLDTAVVVPWNGTDAADTQAMHDPAVNNTKIFIKAAGPYLIRVWGTLQFDGGGSATSYEIALRKNGTTTVRTVNVQPGAFTLEHLDLAAIVGDFYEILTDNIGGLADYRILAAGAAFVVMRIP